MLLVPLLSFQAAKHQWNETPLPVVYRVYSLQSGGCPQFAADNDLRRVVSIRCLSCFQNDFFVESLNYLMQCVLQSSIVSLSPMGDVLSNFLGVRLAAAGGSYRWSQRVAIALLSVSLLLPPAIAAKESEIEEPMMTRQEFLANPLEDEEPDPLLPQIPVERPFSPQELRNLRSDLNALRVEGQALYEADQINQAMEVWIRELRLRRILGPREEAVALGQVGAIAWQENQTQEVRWITERLQQIQAAELEPATQTSLSPPAVDFELLLTVGQALRQLRAYPESIQALRQIVVEAQRRGNPTLQEIALNALAELHRGWFKYQDAATVYQELLAFAQNQEDTAAELRYLEELAQTYDRGKLPEQAIGVQDQLVEAYQRQGNLQPLPGLQVAIANNYRALEQFEQAAQTYEAAYITARSIQQYGYASDALQALADLYESLDRLDDALTVYQVLLEVEQQSYSTYGQMDAYDQIGQIYQQQGNTQRAIAAYQQGLDLAQQISYRQDYFSQKIQALAQGS